MHGGNVYTVRLVTANIAIVYTVFQCHGEVFGNSPHSYMAIDDVADLG